MAVLEAARARVRAAALRGDPLEVEAASRAYLVAVNITLVIDIMHAVRAMLHPVWHSASRRHIAATGAADRGR